MFNSQEQGIRQLAGIYSTFLSVGDFFVYICFTNCKVIHAFCREFRNNRKLQGRKEKFGEN